MHADVTNGSISGIIIALLKIGRGLSDNLNQPLSSLIIGKDIWEATKEIATLADKVYIVECPLFAESHREFYVTIITKVCQQTTLSIVLLSHNDMERDITPRLAARLGCTVITE